MKDNWFTLENHAGNPIRAGDVELIPIAQAARLNIPGIPWHLVWNRPVSLIARGTDGRQAALPIHDTTRRAQLILLAAGLLGSWLLWLGAGSRRR